MSDTDTPPTGPLTLRELNRATLERQHLLARTKATPLEVMERLVAMQSQQARPPFLGLWTRLENFDRQALHTLLHEKKVVRATSLRGTLHLMSAADFLSMRGAIQPVLTQAMTGVLRERAKALDVPKLVEAAKEIFQQGPLTFEAVRDRLLEVFPRSDDRAMGYAVRLMLPLVQVPTEDKWAFPGNAAFTLAEEWLGEKLKEGANAEALVVRYLAAFGPASVADAQSWSGLRGMREAFEVLRPKLLLLKDERKRELFDLPNAPRPDGETPAPVRLIPDFDNLVLGHDDRSRFVSEEDRPSIVTKNLLVRATFLVDGFVSGTWTIDRKKHAATLIFTPFVTIKKPIKAELEREAERLLAFAEDDAKQHEVKWA